MIRVNRHGGTCCGIRHIMTFSGRETIEDIRAAMARTGSMNLLMEVVVTNSQIAYGKRVAGNNLADNLKECGFRLVSRFRNPNSGNICNVFHYTSESANRTLKVTRPFKWG